MTGTVNGNLNLLHKVKKTIEDARLEKYDYEEYKAKHALTKDEIKAQREHVFPYEPMISIITQIKKEDVINLRHTMDSVLSQTYRNIELCVADGSMDDEASNVIASYMREYSYVRYVRTKSSNMPGANINEALDMSHGAYVIYLRCGDELERNAIYEYVKVINKKARIDIIYADQDEFLKHGYRTVNPVFKPNFNMDLLRTNNYIDAGVLVRRSLAIRAGRYDENLAKYYEYDYLLRCVEGTSFIGHISKMLCHVYNEKKEPDIEEEMMVLKKHFLRTGVIATIKPLENPGYYSINYHMDNTPHVTIVINDNADDYKLKRCIESIRSKTIYRSYDILVRKFGAKLSSEQIEGDYVISMDSDYVVLSHNCIERLMERMSQGDVSVVCSKIVDKNKRILHAGIKFTKNGAKYLFRNMPSWQYGYGMRSMLQQNVDAFPVQGIIMKKEDYLMMDFENLTDEIDLNCCKTLACRDGLFSYEPNVLFQKL